jgi:DNA-binding beta-propeller fold protein YncE
VQVVDRASRAVVKTIDVGGIPQRVAFDRLGKVALVTNQNGWVDVVR